MVKKPRHVGPYLECTSCQFDEWAVRMRRDRDGEWEFVFECCGCGQNVAEGFAKATVRAEHADTQAKA